MGILFVTCTKPEPVGSGLTGHLRSQLVCLHITRIEGAFLIKIEESLNGGSTRN